MPKYEVHIPVVAVAVYYLDADTEEGAINAALSKSFSEENITEAEMVRHVVEGNVCNAPLTSAEALELSADDDDSKPE